MGTPKVLSLFQTKRYSECFPEISVLGKKVDFFLECSCYNVILYVNRVSDKMPDIFENAVLRFIDFKSASVEEMAKALCLTPDLISFIIIRLKEEGLLEQNGRALTKEGKEFLNPKNAEKYDNYEFATVRVFAIKLGNSTEILPFVLSGEQELERAEDINNNILTMEYGPTGRPVKVKGKIFRQSRENRPSAENIRDKIKATLEKYNRIVKTNPGFDAINYSRGRAIDYTYSENVYFHMQAVVQNGNTDDILVSDGFAVNIDVVRDYIKNNFPDFIQTVKERAVRINMGGEGQADEVVEYTTDYKYPNAGYYLKRIFRSTDSKDETNSFTAIDENRDSQSNQKEFLLNCYAAFEWILYYYVVEHPIDDNVAEVIKSQSSEQNYKTLMDMLEKIGVNNRWHYKRLFNTLDYGRIKKMYSSDTPTPELRTVLSLAVISAYYDTDGGFRQLLRNNPSTLKIICRLFYEHGNLSHRTKTDEINEKRNKELKLLLDDFVALLLPDFNFDYKGTGAVTPRKNATGISQERLNAQVRLSKELGAQYFFKLMPRSIRDEWILIAPDKDAYPEPSEYVRIMYSIMQDTLYYALKDIRKNSALTKRDILDKLQKHGINAECFNTVREVYISNILMNENGTLGGNAMVYLYCRDDLLEGLIAAGFVDIIGQLVKFRGHGNNPLLDLTVEKLCKIRNKMMTVVKIIGGN